MTLSLIIGWATFSLSLYWLGTWLQPKFLHKQTSHYGWQSLLKVIYFIGLPYGTLISATIPATMFGLAGVATGGTSPSSGSWLVLATSFLTTIFRLILSWLPQMGLLGTRGTLLGLLFLICFGIFLYHYFHLHKTQTPLFEHHKIYIQKKDILFDYAHWSFYRALIWLATNNLYIATFLGGLLILFEYSIASRIAHFAKEKQTAYWLRYGLGATASILFLAVPNLWLTLLYHLVISLIAELLLATVQRYHQVNQLQRSSLK